MKLIDIILEEVELDEVGPRKTNQEWLDEFKSKFPNWDYSEAKFFRNKNSQLCINNVKCKIHNHYFPKEGIGIALYKHLSGTGCFDCGIDRLKQKQTKTTEQWKADFLKNKNFKNKCDFNEIKFSFVEPLKKGPLVTNFKCKIHKKYFNGGPNNQGIRAVTIGSSLNICPDCINDNFFQKTAKPLEDWIKLFKSNKNNKNNNYSKSEVTYDNPKYVLVSNIYCNSIGFDGKRHGFFAQDGVGAYRHSKGLNRCPKCICEDKTRNFIKESKVKHGNKYVYDMVNFCDDTTLIKKQGLNRINSERKVLIGCKTHGYFFQNSTTHKRGGGCPICRESKGELYIRNLLSGFKLRFVSEKKFTESGELEFDFYIPKLKILIEYDGQQHFQPVFGSTENMRNYKYNQTYSNDNRKDEFVRTSSNGLKLIRVPYTLEFSEIGKLLSRKIKTKKQIKTNTVNYIGDYPKRKTPKEPKINESKLSLMGVLEQIL